MKQTVVYVGELRASSTSSARRNRDSGLSLISTGGNKQNEMLTVRYCPLLNRGL